MSVTIFFKYLFTFGFTGFSLLPVNFLQLWQAEAAFHCSLWTSHGGGFSSGAQAPGARLPVAMSRGLWSAGSAVVARGLRCSVACGIFLEQGLSPCLLHWQAVSYSLDHQGSPLC